ncbi:hypothetical protein Pyn_33374 [Prunus yedoensis var. nudiflora]|uniref:Uncharacterized protein n=1 Tax=Prunus yedoensis var. nudiflora TaxID=2094558 RepID=A0A314ZEZ2_PRUYE|nr:hypothetical protein Pyn_33374 [Prunus yedoensis var. nudiflora]
MLLMTLGDTEPVGLSEQLGRHTASLLRNELQLADNPLAVIFNPFYLLEQVQPSLKTGQKAPWASPMRLQRKRSSPGKAWDPPAWASPRANPTWAQTRRR